MGAIPVCQTTYWQADSYAGTGNYTNEINSGGGTCLLSGELNDVWYIFTVITSGELGFGIIPNNSADDYDWALFNLTNANCSDIYSNTGIQVCCNYSGTDGMTGMDNPNNASCNGSASAGTASPMVWVNAGETYVLNISNYSSTQYGYNLNFGNSTATIFDNVPPTFQSVNTAAITCGTNQLSFTFSENILCSTIAPCDFQLTGPGGPYTISAVTGAGCATGAPMENTFTITFSPAMTQPGNYNIALVNTCGSVTDNCANVAPPNNFDFVNSAPGVSVTPTTADICSGDCTSLTASGATTFSWMPGGLTGTTVSVCPGSTTTYTVSGTTTGCTSTAQATVNVTPSPVTTATATPASICIGQSSTLQANGASTYVWQPGGMTGTSVVVNPTATTIYTVTGTNGACTSSTTVTVTVNQNPSITISPANPQMCFGQSVALTTNSSIALSSCTWNPTTGLTPSNSCNPTANPTATTTYFVMGQTASGCSGTASVTVVVNPLPIVSVSSNIPGNTLCAGDCGQLTATSTPAATGWLWSPAAGLSATNISNPTACPSSTTTYTVGSQTAAGCTGSNTITITVNPVSAINIIPSPANICFGEGVQMTVTGTPALANCSWSPTTGLTPPTGSCSPIASPSVTTTYTITGQNAAGCTSSNSVTVNVNPNPVITITPTSATICFGESTPLQADCTPAGLVTQWLWTPATGLSSTSISNPTADPTATTTYTVTGTSAAGCTGSSSVTITVNPLPILDFPALPLLCISSPLFPLDQATPTGGSYSGPGVFNDSLAPNIAGVGTHTITYTYTDPVTGCTNSITQTITINAGISVGVNPSSAFICPEDDITLTAIGADTYIWTPPLGLNITSGPVVVAKPPSSIIYTVTGTDANGCSGSTTATINYYNTSLVNILATPPWGCNPVEISMSFAPSNMITDLTWHWDFGDYYSNDNVSTDKYPSHLYQHEGNYIITFTAQDTNGCTVSDYEPVEVFISPLADFYYTPLLAYSDNPDINFIDLSMGANSWLWDFDDPASYNDNFSETQNPFHSFSDTGTFLVQLIVTSSHNCSDTVEKPVTILPQTLIYIPNAFTPDKDQLNDIFKPVITGVDENNYVFTIFDRWGREQFYTENIDEGWDGKYKGKECAEGVYVYLIIYHSYAGKEFKMKGIVTLVR